MQLILQTDIQEHKQMREANVFYQRVGRKKIMHANTVRQDI
jgi:hypothetical protein